MPRPKKCRRIGHVQRYRKYGPRDRNQLSNDVITIELDEIESIRLKDIEKLDQSQGAEKMGVSRQTFQNILESARNKVARSIINGLEIHIAGGHIINNQCIAVCEQCGNSFDINKGEWHGICEKCGSTHLYCPKKDKRCCY